MVTHSSNFAWKVPMDRGSWWVAAPWGHKESDTTERLKTHTHTHIHIYNSHIILILYITGSET